MDRQGPGRRAEERRGGLARPPPFLHKPLLDCPCGGDQCGGAAAARQPRRSGRPTRPRAPQAHCHSGPRLPAPADCWDDRSRRVGGVQARPCREIGDTPPGRPRPATGRVPLEKIRRQRQEGSVLLPPHDRGDHGGAAKARSASASEVGGRAAGKSGHTAGTSREMGKGGPGQNRKQGYSDGEGQGSAETEGAGFRSDKCPWRASHGR